MFFLGRRRDDPVDILVVCTGNVCRSPYLAARLRTALPRLTVSSAGTAALVGRPPTDEVLQLLADGGVDARAPAARRLGRPGVRGARLVITAERRHRLEAVRLEAGAASRTFTVKELARLVAGLPDGAGLDAVLAHAASAVGLDGSAGSGRDHDDDLADPYGLDQAAYERMAQEADQLVASLVRVLRE